MKPLHQRISSIKLQPRESAADYQKLYSQIKELAKGEDNKHGVDHNFRAGEVWLRSRQDDEYVTLGFQRDEGYVGEHLSVYQTQLDDEGKSRSKVGLRAEPTDKSERYLKFEHLVDDSAPTVILVDTRQGTLFQQSS